MSKNFFQVLSPAEFRTCLQSFPARSAQNAPVESVLLEESRGRILAEDIIAAENIPLTSRSSMDGYAILSKDTFGASEGLPAFLECVVDLRVDEVAQKPLQSGECARIVTGGPIPEGCDAVVMVEHTAEVGAGSVEIFKPSAPGENIMLKGEDVTQGETALKAGTLIRAQEIGLMAALGVTDPKVLRQPCAGIISTGDEVIPIDETPRPGQVRDVNTYTLATMCRSLGLPVKSYGIVKDNLDDLCRVLGQALEETHCVFISGGSSVGARDFTVAAIESIPDSRILAHGVAISPGKPTILASCGKDPIKPVWGMPGQVTSAQVVMLVFGVPFLRYLSGQIDAFNSPPLSIRAQLTKNMPSKPGREEHVRVALEYRDNGEIFAHPLTGKSGLLKTLVKAEGLVSIPVDVEGLRAGTICPVQLITV